MEALTISVVERETKLSKELLRAWEKRYGFPAPLRAANGERLYPPEQVERLCLMKRLVDQGYRPGKLARLSTEQLAMLPPYAGAGRAQDAQRSATPSRDRDRDDGTVDRLLATIKRDPHGFRHAMGEQLTRRGLERFVQHVAAPLTMAVGKCWQEGEFEISDEHLYTQETARVLSQSIAALPRDRHAPCIMLTTLPGEPHSLGLLMAEAMFALDGAACIALGTETPLFEIVRAASAYAVDVVALSFSAASPQRRIGAALRQLRQALPAHIALWAGGAGIDVQGMIEDVHLLPSLASGRRAVADWRLAQGLGHGGTRPHVM